MNLTEVKKGEKAVIVKIDGDRRYLSRITSIGLNVGCRKKEAFTNLWQRHHDCFEPGGIRKNKSGGRCIMGDTRNIALLGQPNSGKSTIFNTLTGMHQHVGNWPGKTVEKKEGTFTYNNITYTVADLPGSYSLSANSDEEIVTRDYVARTDLDLVCILADASQLERSMYMLADYAGIKTPVMLVLTMMDVAESNGKKIDTKKLSEKLGINVCSVVAFDKKTYELFHLQEKL